MVPAAASCSFSKRITGARGWMNKNENRMTPHTILHQEDRIYSKKESAIVDCCVCCVCVWCVRVLAIEWGAYLSCLDCGCLCECGRIAFCCLVSRDLTRPCQVPLPFARFVHLRAFAVLLLLFHFFKSNLYIPQVAKPIFENPNLVVLKGTRTIPKKKRNGRTPPPFEESLYTKPDFGQMRFRLNI